MNKNVKLISKEISQGANLEVNLPQFFNHLATLYKKYADIKFTLQYYTYYESFADKNFQSITEEERSLLSEVNEIIKDSILSDFSGEKMESNVKRLDAARNHIMKQMQILTAYTDIMQNFEYILNRVEYRFRTDGKEINNEEFTADILKYIFDTKDNIVIHGKIQEILGQLPVRVLKTKYFELLSNSLSIYKGADCSSLDTYTYMLKNGAMIYNPEGMDTAYPELLFLKNEMEKLDYENITEDQYKTYASKIEKAAGMINTFVDFYYGLQEIVNPLYVLIITAPYADIEDNDKEIELYNNIISRINGQFKTGSNLSLADEIDEKLVITEGQQEYLVEEFEHFEYTLSEIKSNHSSMVESLMLGRLFHSLSIAQNLLGNSLFIELNQVENNEKADEKYVLKVQEELITQLMELFRNSSKNVYRAVVANTINKMPVFFQSTNEVADYVKNALEQCQDAAEKNGCYDIIQSFMEN